MLICALNRSVQGWKCFQETVHSLSLCFRRTISKKQITWLQLMERLPSQWYLTTPSTCSRWIDCGSLLQMLQPRSCILTTLGFTWSAFTIRHCAQVPCLTLVVHHHVQPTAVAPLPGPSPSPLTRSRIPQATSYLIPHELSFLNTWSQCKAPLLVWGGGRIVNRFRVAIEHHANVTAPALGCTLAWTANRNFGVSPNLVTLRASFFCEGF